MGNGKVSESHGGAVWFDTQKSAGSVLPDMKMTRNIFICQKMSRV